MFWYIFFSKKELNIYLCSSGCSSWKWTLCLDRSNPGDRYPQSWHSKYPVTAFLPSWNFESKWIFYDKNHLNLSKSFFFFIDFSRSTFFCKNKHLITSIFEPHYYKDHAQFLTNCQGMDSQNLVISFDYRWFLAKSLFRTQTAC